MKRCFVLMNFPLSSIQMAEIMVNWGVNSFCYPPETVKKLWAEIPPEAANVNQLVEPVVDWLGEVDGGDVVVLYGDAAAISVIKKQLPDLALITPVIKTGGGTFQHVRFKVI
jgi:hypothetical protein